MISPYIIILIVLAISALYRAEQVGGVLFNLEYALLTAMLALRFGQGTDWGGYCYLYLAAPSKIDLGSSFYSASYHSEIGWKLLMNLFKASSCNFFTVSLVISLVEMILLYRFIKRWSIQSRMSILLFYPTYFLTYYFSAMREGLVVAFFLGILVDLYSDREYIKYILIVLMLSTLHSAALIVLIAPIIRNISMKGILITVAISLMLGLIGRVWVPFISIGSSTSYSHVTGFSSTAFIYRISILVLIIISYYNGIEEIDMSRYEALMSMYLSGFIVYLLFIRYPILGSRLSAIMCVVEVALIPNLLYRGKLEQQRLILIVILSMIVIMTSKNLDSYIAQGKYVQDLNWYNYPYISVFNKDDLYQLSSNINNIYTINAFST